MTDAPLVVGKSIQASPNELGRGSHVAVVDLVLLGIYILIRFIIGIRPGVTRACGDGRHAPRGC
jgi:hypothetical protein